MRTLVAFLAAVSAPACLFTLWYLYGQFIVFPSDDPYIWVRTWGVLVASLTFSAAHVVLLGAPAYFLLRWRGLLRWWSITAAGFVLGALPLGAMTWPLRYAALGSSSSVNGVDTMINGTVTTAGWLQYAQGVFFFGACGVIAAVTFFAVLRMRPNYAFKRTAGTDHRVS
jgi:hypothetical protein